MPWMEFLIVVGIVAETAVLKVLLAVGGERVLFATLVSAVCFVGPLLHQFRPGGREQEGLHNDIFEALIITPPFAMVVLLILRQVWPH